MAVPVQTTQTVFGDKPLAYQQTSATENDFGALIGTAEKSLATALEGGADKLQQHVIRIKGLNDEADAKAAHTKALELLNDLQWNPKTGYLNSQGKNAAAGFDAAVASANTIAEEALKGLNEDAARMARSAIAASTISARSTMQRHAAVENTKFRFESSEAHADTVVRAAALDYNNQIQFERALTTAREEAFQQGEMLGETAEQIGLRQQKYTDKAWLQRLDAWRLHDAVGALDTFMKNQDAISPHLRPQVQRQLFQDANGVLASMVVRGQLDTTAVGDDEAKAIAESAAKLGIPFTVKVGGEAQNVFDRLPGDQKLQVLNQAYTQSQQDLALGRRRLDGLMRDAEAAAMDGKQMTIPESAFNVLGAEAPAALAQYRNSQQLAYDIAQVSTLPVAERVKLAESRVPPAGGPGYAEAAKRSDILSRAVVEANRRQQEDPAAFTVTTAPQTVGVAFHALQQALGGTDPAQRRTAAQAFATATAAEQERLGGIARKPGQALPTDLQILPRPLADQIARSFLNPAEGGQGPAQLIQAQSDMWGAYWPQVYRQIAKDIGPTARVVSNLRDTPAAAMLSMNAAVKTEELRKPVGADGKLVDDTVDGEMEPFRQSLIGWTTGGSTTYNDFNEAARRNAYVYAAQGQKPGDAAKRAVREVVGDYYEFRGPTRFPKTSTLDPDVAQKGMQAVLNAADTLGVRIPPGEAAVLGADFTTKQLAQAVKNNGFFVTLGDDSGVALFMQGANGARAVEGPDGKPITFGWSELMQRGSVPVKPGRGVINPSDMVDQQTKGRK